MLIRFERPTDVDTIREIHRAAFPSPAEAELVDKLREARLAKVSIVADADGELLGHALFSPVTLVGARRPAKGLGLGPVAVRPERQKQGVGTRLIETGIAQSRRAGYDFVVVLGAPAYYRRFGFRQASRFGLLNEYGADEEFLALELSTQSLAGVGGRVQYAGEFGALQRRQGAA